MACLGSVTTVVTFIEARAVAAGTHSCVKKSTVQVGMQQFVCRKSAGSHRTQGRGESYLISLAPLQTRLSGAKLSKVEQIWSNSSHT